jgi:TPR repeat protein
MSFYYEHHGLGHAVQMVELQQKAEAGDLPSQFQYGRFLVYDAEGGPKERIVAEGVRWLKSAADKGHLGAIETMAGIYLHGAPGIEADRDEGMRLTLIAAEMGSGEVVDTLAYHFSYGDSADLVKGYAYFRLEEYVAEQTGYSAEIACDNLNDLRRGMDESQIKQAEDLFLKLRDELEAKPLWRNARDEKKRASDKDRYPRLMNMYAEASGYANDYPEELARIKGLIDKLEAVMNREDMIEIRTKRAKAGLPNSPESPFNKPSILERGCLGLIVLSLLPVAGLYWLNS